MSSEIRSLARVPSTSRPSIETDVKQARWNQDTEPGGFGLEGGGVSDVVGRYLSLWLKKVVHLQKPFIGGFTSLKVMGNKYFTK